jgi:MFS family permease
MDTSGLFPYVNSACLIDLSSDLYQAWTISITCAFLILYASPTLHLTSAVGVEANSFSSGPNTDLLGRRWFLVLGNLVCFVGHVIVASAKNTNQIIAGLAVSGFGGANCQVRPVSSS